MATHVKSTPGGHSSMKVVLMKCKELLLLYHCDFQNCNSLCFKVLLMFLFYAIEDRPKYVNFLGSLS